MAASTTDLISKVTSGSYAAPARVQTARSSGVTTLLCDALTGWDATTLQFFVTYRLDGTGKVVAGSEVSWTGIVSGNSINTMVVTAGTDTGSQVGDIVETIPTHEWVKRLAQAILAEHGQDGHHTAITPTSVASTGPVSGTTGTFSGAVSDNGITLQTVRSESSFDYIASGCVWSGDAYASTRNASCTSGVVYLSGKRLTVAAVTARSFTASKDVYCDLHDNGDGTAVWVYTDGTTNAASPALTAGNLRGAIIVVGASSIAAATSVNQGQETMVVPIASSTPYAVTDSLGNLICPRDQNRKLLGYRQIVSNFNTASASAVQVTGLSVPIIVPTGGKRIKLTIWTQGLSNSTTAYADFAAVDGVVGVGTQVTFTQVWASTAGRTWGSSASAILTVPAGSKTYNASLWAEGGGTATAVGNVTSPTFLMIEAI